MTEHEVKCWPEFFKDIWNRKKRFELRRNDRNYKVGDKLRIKEYNPSEVGNEYTGLETCNNITYILGNKNDCEKFGLMPGFVILGIDQTFRVMPHP